jgi:enoyl-CoA hydratase
VLDGVQAERLGIVQWAVPQADVPAFARRVAACYAEMPKAALAANKRCIAAATDPDIDGDAAEITETRRLYDNPETRSKVSAFLARRAH